jgi:hypothetical protein
MNTLTATASRNENESTFRRIARAFFAEVRRSLEFMGKAYAHGVR